MIGRLAFVAVLAALGQPVSAQTAPPLANALMSDDNIRLVNTLSRLVQDVCLPIANASGGPASGGEAWRRQHGLKTLSPAETAAVETELKSQAVGPAMSVTGFEGQLQVVLFEGARCRILLRHSPLARAAQIGLGLDLGGKPDWLTGRVRDEDAMFVHSDPTADKRVALIQRTSDSSGTDNTLQLVITVATVPEAVIKAAPGSTNKE